MHILKTKARAFEWGWVLVFQFDALKNQSIFLIFSAYFWHRSETDFPHETFTEVPVLFLKHSVSLASWRHELALC